MIEIIAYTIDGDPWKLDIDQNEVILFNQFFLDLKDLGERRGNYTKSFALPGTENNHKYFGSYADPSNEGLYYSDVQETRAILIEDSFVIIDGSLRLDRTDGKGDFYHVSIYGTVKTVKNLLGEARISDVGMTDWTHTLAQVPSTWTRSLFSGHLVYPVHDFGQGYGLYSDVAGTSTLINIKNSATPMYFELQIPAFRMIEIIKRIFLEHDITVSGDFITDTDNQEIYVQPDTQAVKPLGYGSKRLPLKIGHTASQCRCRKP